MKLDGLKGNMQKNNEKRGSKDKKLNIAIILAVIVIISLTLFIYKKTKLFYEKKGPYPPLILADVSENKRMDRRIFKRV